MTTLPDVAAGQTGHISHHDELHKAHNAGNVFLWFYGGNVAVATGTGRIRPGYACELIECYLEADIAPAGAVLIANVRLNGTAILAGASRPRLQIAQTSGAVAPFTGQTLTATDRLTADMEQVGSTTPGADVTLHVRLRPI